MDNLTEKLTSARFWVTMILTLSFAHLTYVGKVSAEVFVPVFIVVVHYYFTRKRKEDDEETTVNPGVNVSNN